MNILSWFLALSSAILLVKPANAEYLTDFSLIERTQPGFHYPGPFNSPQQFIIYQRPTGSWVWNGRWFVYQEPYSDQRALRRAY